MPAVRTLGWRVSHSSLFPSAASPQTRSLQPCDLGASLAGPPTQAVPRVARNSVSQSTSSSAFRLGLKCPFPREISGEDSSGSVWVPRPSVWAPLSSQPLLRSACLFGSSVCVPRPSTRARQTALTRERAAGRQAGPPRIHTGLGLA